MSRQARMTIAALAAFAAYLWTMPPSLPAYRDAGEMAVSAYTLGVSHPPSYPLYILAGHVAQQFPLGTPAWRLTLFSAAAAACAVAVLFEIVLALAGLWPALAAAVLVATNITFWSVAVVPEMYALMLLMGLTLMALAFKLGRNYDRRIWYGFSFLYGLFLGNRADLVLWAPGLLWLALIPEGLSRERKFRPRWILGTLAFSLLGFSVYLYLPLRSMQNPWLDWNHPATLNRFIGSLTRRGYGGTLDLLSKSYAPGSMFGPNLLVYARHLWKDYLGLAAALVPLGLWSWWRRDRKTFWALALMYAASGPLFLYMGNMPPNPHALAIVEPHYLLSDMILALWVAEGLRRLISLIPAFGQSLNRLIPSGALALAAFGPMILGLGFLARGEFWSRVDRRWNLFDYDYCRNVMRSLPRDSTLVAKKDVQLFSLWYFQTVEGLRPDVHLVAQGLSASPWYQESRRRQGETAYIGPLRDASDWREFSALNGPGTYATPDAEFPNGLPLGPPRGLAIGLSTASAVDDSPWALMVRRGNYEYERQPDFFDSDLIDAYAASRQRLGNFYLQGKKWEEAVRLLRSAWSMHWLLPDAPALLGFIRFSAGNLPEALAAYELAAGLSEKTLELTSRYHSLEDVVRSIKHAEADALINCGVVLEKLGRKDESQARYRRAIELDPDFAQAHFNLAVLYWDRDWAAVAAEMSEVLRIDPSRRDAARYLSVARFHLAQSQRNK